MYSYNHTCNYPLGDGFKKHAPHDSISDVDYCDDLNEVMEIRWDNNQYCRWSNNELNGLKECIVSFIMSYEIIIDSKMCLSLSFL